MLGCLPVCIVSIYLHTHPDIGGTSVWMCAKVVEALFGLALAFWLLSTIFIHIFISISIYFNAFIVARPPSAALTRRLVVCWAPAKCEFVLLLNGTRLWGNASKCCRVAARWGKGYKTKRRTSGSEHYFKMRAKVRERREEGQVSVSIWV